MVVFHFMDSYLELTETFMYNYILICSRKMERVFIITYWTQHTEQFPLPANVEFILLPAKPKGRKTLSGMYAHLYAKFTGCPLEYVPLRKKLIKYKRGLVHCHFGNRGIEFMKILEVMRMNKKFVVSFYGYDIGYLVHNEPGYVEQLQKLWETCSGVFAEGPFMLGRLEALGLPAKKSYLNPILIDTGLYPEKSLQSVERSNKTLNCLIVGRFVEKKGIHISLQAFGELKKQGYTNFYITLVGDGPMKENYLNIITAYELSDQVDFKGMLSHEKCKELLFDHDVLLHPSLESAAKDSEGGAPTIIIEAQCIGTMVIASFHADIPFVMGYHDLLCKENDEEDLIRVIRKYIDMPVDQRNSLIAQGRTIVKKQHTLDTGKYIENLQTVLAKN